MKLLFSLNPIKFFVRFVLFWMLEQTYYPLGTFKKIGTNILIAHIWIYKWKVIVLEVLVKWLRVCLEKTYLAEIENFMLKVL